MSGCSPAIGVDNSHRPGPARLRVQSDGEVTIVDVQRPRVTARVVHGGQMGSHKGMNLPGVQVSAPFNNVRYALEVFEALPDFGARKEAALRK